MLVNVGEWIQSTVCHHVPALWEEPYKGFEQRPAYDIRNKCTL